jgi:preprotein translocase subunit SecF
VIGLLTILGYSLYDTVVVFDKVKENTRGIVGQSVMTYGDAANLAVNQTLVRSINTSIVALLPVLAIIIVGAGFLGAGTLLDLAVVLFIGMAAGTYSSIFIATPFLVQLKEGQPEMKALAARVSARRKQARSAPAASTDDAVVESAPVVSNKTSTITRTESTTRQQPKKQPRSKRSKG